MQKCGLKAFICFVAVTEADINEALEEGVELHMEGAGGDERQPTVAPAATNGPAPSEEDKETDKTAEEQDNPAEISWQETKYVACFFSVSRLFLVLLSFLFLRGHPSPWYSDNAGEQVEQAILHQGHDSYQNSSH